MTGRRAHTSDPDASDASDASNDSRPPPAKKARPRAPALDPANIVDGGRRRQRSRAGKDIGTFSE
jgi:hypothetical protein